MQTLYNIIGVLGCWSLTSNVTINDMSDIIINAKRVFNQWGHLVEITALLLTEGWYGTILAHVNGEYHCHYFERYFCKKILNYFPNIKLWFFSLRHVYLHAIFCRFHLRFYLFDEVFFANGWCFHGPSFYIDFRILRIWTSYLPKVTFECTLSY